MSLKDIVSQDKAVNTLQRAFAAGKMPHAYIFAGSDGVGKRTCTEQWAKMLLCQNRIEKKIKKDGLFYDSCGKCKSCLLFEGQGHPDYKSIYKELIQFTKDGRNKKTPVDMPIDVIREFLIEKIANRPAMGDYVVYVVDEAEKLNQSSQNALLKVLEEPPGFCVIILLCSRLDRMLQTTLSRCRVLQFGPVDEKHITEKLCQEGTAEKEAKFWARFTDHSLGVAMDWAHLELEDQNCYQIKCRIVKKLADFELAETVDFAEMLSQFSSLISKVWTAKAPNKSKTDINRRIQKGLIRMMICAFHDAMKLKAGTDTSLINSDQMPQINSIAKRFETEELADMVNKGYQIASWVDRNVNEKLFFEELLLNFARCGIISF